MSTEALQSWLKRLDAMPLECDGLARAASALLARERIAHCVEIGGLEVEGVGKIAPHFWVRLQDGRICDWRARMWLGQDDPRVAHGVFKPAPGQHYVAEGLLDEEIDPVLFQLLSGVRLEDYPRLGRSVDAKEQA